MKRSTLIVVLAVLNAAGLLFPSVGVAQLGPSLAGITVSGIGVATGPAENASFQIFLINQNAMVGAARGASG